MMTVSFRGKLRGNRRAEAFEDRILEVALEFGGYARVWRSASKEKPERVIRGVLLDLAPGLGTASLLVSPEGTLVPPAMIAQAEDGPIFGDVWNTVRTDFAKVEAHVLLIELFAALEQEFLTDLEVADEGKYWGSRNFDILKGNYETARKLIGQLQFADAKPLPESAMTMVASLPDAVKRLRSKVSRPPEFPPVVIGQDEESGRDPLRTGTERIWDCWYRQNERRHCGLARAFEERNLYCTDTRQSFNEAMRSEGMFDVPGLGDRGATNTDDSGSHFQFEAIVHAHRHPGLQKHPLLRRATKLSMKTLKLPERGGDSLASPLNQLVKGIFEISGALSQVFGARGRNKIPYGFRLTQLKRAERGADFARASLTPAFVAGLLGESDCREIFNEVTGIKREIALQIQKNRQKWKG